MSCHKVMEQDRKDKEQGRAGVWDPAAQEKGKEKVVGKEKAGDKVRDAARGKVKVLAKGKGKAADKISKSF